MVRKSSIKHDFDNRITQLDRIKSNLQWAFNLSTFGVYNKLVERTKSLDTKLHRTNHKNTDTTTVKTSNKAAAKIMDNVTDQVPNSLDEKKKTRFQDHIDARNAWSSLVGVDDPVLFVMGSLLITLKQELPQNPDDHELIQQLCNDIQHHLDLYRDQKETLDDCQSELVLMLMLQSIEFKNSALGTLCIHQVKTLNQAILNEKEGLFRKFHQQQSATVEEQMRNFRAKQTHQTTSQEHSSTTEHTSVYHQSSSLPEEHESHAHVRLQHHNIALKRLRIAIDEHLDQADEIRTTWHQNTTPISQRLYTIYHALLAIIKRLMNMLSKHKAELSAQHDAPTPKEQAEDETRSQRFAQHEQQQNDYDALAGITDPYILVTKIFLLDMKNKQPQHGEDQQHLAKLCQSLEDIMARYEQKILDADTCDSELKGILIITSTDFNDTTLGQACISLIERLNQAVHNERHGLFRAYQDTQSTQEPASTNMSKPTAFNPRFLAPKRQAPNDVEQDEHHWLNRPNGA